MIAILLFNVVVSAWSFCMSPKGSIVADFLRSTDVGISIEGKGSKESDDAFRSVLLLAVSAPRSGIHVSKVRVLIFCTSQSRQASTNQQPATTFSPIITITKPTKLEDQLCNTQIALYCALKRWHFSCAAWHLECYSFELGTFSLEKMSTAVVIITLISRRR